MAKTDKTETPIGFDAEILKEWGKHAVVAGVDIEHDNSVPISTNSFRLDWALGLPFVEGSINEIHGDNGCGKTTLALEVGANATLMDKKVYYFDLERKLTKSQIDMIPRLKRELFWRIRPEHGEDAVNKVVKCVSEVPGCVVIFDSLTQLLPEVEDAENAEKNQMGAIARLAAKMVRKIAALVERNKCMVLFISHITTSMNPYQAGDVTKGGKAVPDISSQRVKLKRVSADLLKDANGNIIGQMTTCKVIKNNQAAPFREVSIPIIYGRGIDKHLDLLLFAKELAIVECVKGWYTCDLFDGSEPKKRHEADMVQIIAENDKYREALIAKIKEIL